MMVAVDVVAQGLLLACPVLLAALGELLTERVGVLNIGVEGTMLFGAFAAAVLAASSGDAMIGLVGALAAGVACGLLFAGLAVQLGADQVIVGAALNLLALGITGALYRVLAVGSAGVALLPAIPRPSPEWLGPTVASLHVLVWAALLLVAVLGFVFARTGVGRRLRALGEHPQAVATLGVSVRRWRVAAVVVGSALGGLAGGTLVLGTAGSFVEGVTAGRGFVALAAVVFGRWSAVGVLAGTLVFGLASALQFRLQARDLGVAWQLFLILPYLATLVALLAARGRGAAPAALGRPYRSG